LTESRHWILRQEPEANQEIGHFRIIRDDTIRNREEGGFDARNFLWYPLMKRKKKEEKTRRVKSDHENKKTNN
jgi:hypothetical protein